MTICIDCLQLKAKLYEKNEELRQERERVKEFEDLMQQARMSLKGVEATTMELFTVMARLEKDNKIILERQMRACGGK